MSCRAIPMQILIEACCKKGKDGMLLDKEKDGRVGRFSSKFTKL